MNLFSRQRQIRTACCRVFVTAKKLPSRNRFLRQRFACLTSRGLEANRRREKQLKRNSQSEASAKDSSNEATNQVAFNKKPRPASQPIRFIGRTFYGESTRSDGQNRIGQSYHLDDYLPVINGHSLRRHPQDRMVRP